MPQDELKYFSLSYFLTICCEHWQILPARTNIVFKWCIMQCLVYCRVYVHKMICTKMAFSFSLGRVFLLRTMLALVLQPQLLLRIPCFESRFSDRTIRIMRIRFHNSSLLSALWSESCTIFVLSANTWILRGACARKVNNDAEFVKGPIEVNYHSMQFYPSFPLAESPPRDLQITAYK